MRCGFGIHLAFAGYLQLLGPLYYFALSILAKSIIVNHQRVFDFHLVHVMAWKKYQPYSDIPVRRSWWRRLGWWVIVTILLFTASTLARHYWKMHLAQQELDQVIAQLDRDDPGWRLEDIEANREVIPQDENSARVVLLVAHSLPKGWNKDEVNKELDENPPNHRLREKTAGSLRASLAPLDLGLKKIQRLARMPKGRYPIHYTDDFISTLVPHVDHLRSCYDLLGRDLADKTERGQFEGALETAAAFLNATRSMGDEPLMISQLVRIAGQNLCLTRLEGLLAQGMVSDPALAKLQKVWEREIQFSSFKHAIRAERAGLQIACQSLSDGKVFLDELSGKKNYQPSWYDRINHFLARPMFLESQSWLLKSMTKALPTLDGSLSDQRDAMELFTVEARDPNTPIVGKLLVPPYQKVWEAQARSLTKINSALAAFAVERYRLKYNRWPEKLEELCPELLSSVPVDPFDGGPLFFKSTDDGKVIYSRGPQGKMNGDYWERPPSRRDQKDASYEFRLWNPESRRLPPLPAPKDPDEEIWP